MYSIDAARMAVRILKETQAYDDRCIVNFAKEVLKIVGYYPVRVEKIKPIERKRNDN